MSTEIDREARAFRTVYALMLDRAPAAPTVEQLRGLEDEVSLPPRGTRRGLALAGTGLVVLLSVLALLFGVFATTPSALAAVEDARRAFTELPPFRATLVARVDGEVVAAELAPGTTMADRVYVNDLWYQGPLAWRVDVVEDSVPVLSGGPGSVRIWDGSQTTAYRADENTFSVESEQQVEAGPLHLLDPDLAQWPLLGGGAVPSDEYFAEQCEVVSEPRFLDRPSRRLSCEGGYIEVWLDEQTGLVLKAVGPEAGHELTDLVFNLEFPPGTFEFTSPPGARSTDEVAQDPYAQVALIQGEQAPSWEVQLLNGELLRLEDLQGDPTLILLWADWCPPCTEQSLPLLQQVHEHTAGTANHLAVDIFGTRELAQEVIAEGGYDFPVAIDEECPGCPPPAVSAAWSVESVPIWVVLDAEGRVVEVLLGRDARLELLLGLLAGPD